MDIRDLAMMTYQAETSEEEKKELVKTISDISIHTLELIRQLQAKIDTLMTEKPEKLIHDLTEQAYLLYIALEMYSGEGFEVEKNETV